MSEIPQLPAELRIAQSLLTDSELAYINDLILLSTTIQDNVPGWTVNAAIKMDTAFARAANHRGIKGGVRVVTQTVELRS